MIRTFNCGLGFVLVTSADNASAVLSQLHRAGEPLAAVVGSVVSLNTGMYHPAILCFIFHRLH